MNPGISVGSPMHWDDVKGALYPDTAEAEDFTYERVARLHRLLRGEPASTFSGVEGIESFSDHVQPHSPGLADRLWYGAASESSSRRAGEQGLNLLTSSVVRVGPDEEPDFAAIQARSIRAFREAFGRAGHGTADAARVSQGLVVIPTDSATPEQRAKYEAYVEARTPRTASPQGPGRLLFARDVLGTSDEIAEALYAHAGFRESREVVFALPFSFAHEDYVQILTDMATRLGPALGWTSPVRIRA